MKSRSTAALPTLRSISRRARSTSSICIYTDSPPAAELPPEEVKRDLEAAIERLRSYQASLKPSLSKQEFLKYKEAITLAAQIDSLQGILMLAENETQQHEKFRLFYKAANEKNDPTAMMMLGILYAKGAGDVSGRPDFQKALEWLQKAAEAGNTEAAAYYYDCYLYGDPNTKRGEDDQKAAVEKLKELAGQGEAHAAVVLGQWYRSTARTTSDKVTGYSSIGKRRSGGERPRAPANGGRVTI